MAYSAPRALLYARAMLMPHAALPRSCADAAALFSPRLFYVRSDARATEARCCRTQVYASAPADAYARAARTRDASDI